MSIQADVVQQIKEAMKSKDKVALVALRSLKSTFMLANTESGSGTELAYEQELKIVQKQVKQRIDSAELYSGQGREDLAAPELAEAEVLSKFLPKALTEDEIITIVKEVIVSTSASGMQDMGRVMGIVSKQLAGKSDGKTISVIVKSELN